MKSVGIGAEMATSDWEDVDVIGVAEVDGVVFVVGMLSATSSTLEGLLRQLIASRS